MINKKKSAEERAKIRSERDRRFVAKKKAQGLKRISVWVPEEALRKADSDNMHHIGIVLAEDGADLTPCVVCRKVNGKFKLIALDDSFPASDKPAADTASLKCDAAVASIGDSFASDGCETSDIDHEGMKNIESVAKPFSCKSVETPLKKPADSTKGSRPEVMSKAFERRNDNTNDEGNSDSFEDYAPY